MVKIAPSILAASFSNLGGDVVELNNSPSVDYIHVDVMDGHFVPNISFGPMVFQAVRSITNKVFDVHLMISHPQQYLDSTVKAGSDIITIHEEIESDKFSLLKEIKKKQKKAGIVYKPNTPLDSLEQYLPFLDQILIMSVEPGFGGQSFIQDALKRIEWVKNLLIKNNITHIEIEVDGGINLATGKDCIRAGVDILVIGSAYFSIKSSSEREAMLHELKEFQY